MTSLRVPCWYVCGDLLTFGGKFGLFQGDKDENQPRRCTIPHSAAPAQEAALVGARIGGFAQYPTSIRRPFVYDGRSLPHLPID